MIITSLHGTFSINSCEKDQDKLIVRSKEKDSLMRIFDSKRIIQCEIDGSSYFVTLCKQEFAHSLIMLVKEVNYSDFNQLQSEIKLAMQ
ncbi:hypothetical protein [Shivajiella indica]|uniref:Uncharacterized protein n=1 Tax=Shivajiella indica TaxID=872115 RepID=A0ABW5B7V5_9BACT